MARSLNRDVIVLLEVDAGVLLGGIVGCAKELSLDAGVGRASNMLARACLAINLPTTVA